MAATIKKPVKCKRFVQRYHTGVRPSAEHLGVVLLGPDGDDCCSALDGWLVLPDGTFDLKAAEEQCDLTTSLGQFDEVAFAWLECRKMPKQ